MPDMRLNCTDVNGTLVRIAYVTKEVPQTTEADDSNTDDDYDQTGAMHFIVATVLVYSILGVFCVLINRIKRLSGGQSQTKNAHDESIHRYLKNERMLKIDGRKLKMQYECELVVDKLKQFEERQKLLGLEKELTTGFCRENYSEGRKKRKTRKKKLDIGNTLGKMGASLFYIGSDPPAVVDNKLADDSGIVSDGKYADDQLSDELKPVIHIPKHSKQTDDAERKEIVHITNMESSF